MEIKIANDLLGAWETGGLEARQYLAGSIVDVPADVAESLIRDDFAVPVRGAGAANRETKDGSAGAIDGMSIADLRQVADELGIDHSGLKKADLVAALEAATSADDSASSDDDTPEEASDG